MMNIVKNVIKWSKDMAKVIKDGLAMELILEVGFEWWKQGSHILVEEHFKERDAKICNERRNESWKDSYSQVTN